MKPSNVSRFLAVAAAGWVCATAGNARGAVVGAGKHSTFSVSGVGQGTISGVSGVAWSDFSKTDCYGARTFVHAGIPDAEKTSKTTDDDETWCYPMSDMDALFMTGWADKTGYKTVDDMKESFTAKTLRGFSATEYGINVTEGTYGFRENGSWGDFFNWFKAKAGIDLVARGKLKEGAVDGSLLSTLKRHLDNGAGVVRVNVSFEYVEVNKTWKGKGTYHGVLCVGYVADGSTLKALFIIDPDNDQHTGSGGRSAPNSIVYCPVSWNSSWGEWTISGIWGQDGVLDGKYRALAAMNDPVPPAPTKYTVAFKANGGKGKMASQKMTRDKTAKLKKVAFSRSGYVFIGWAKTKNGAVAYKNKASVKNLAAGGKTATLYAKWAKKTYKVKFYANGGKGKMAVESFKYGKAKKLSANKFKAPKGKKFAGWAKSKANAKAGTVAYRNKAKVKNLVTTGKTVKLYAVWVPKNPVPPLSPDNESYDVFFDANGGAGHMYAQSFEAGERKALSANAYVNPGFCFAGWSTAPGGSVAYADRDVVSNLSKGTAVWLYAVWKTDPVHPAKTLSFCGRSFRTDSRAPWSATTVDGKSALVSAPIGDGEKSTLYLTVSGPGTLSCKVRVLCQVGCDELVFDGPYGLVWKGSGVLGEWKDVSCSVPSGTHIVTWTYEKDASGSVSSDCGWIADVTWTAN